MTNILSLVIDELGEEQLPELRPLPVGAERGVGLLEHDRHDVVADVPLPLELLGVCLGEGEEAADGVHDLLAAVLRVDALLPRLAKLGVEAAPIALVRGQVNSVSDHLQEPVQRGRVAPVTEQRLLAGLPRPLVDHAELEVELEELDCLVQRLYTCLS